MSNKKYTPQLNKLLERKNNIISQLLNTKIMFRGSLVHVHTKCGKDNCHCKNGKGHPHTRVSWRENGKNVTRKAPKQHLDWIKKMIDNYQKFRTLRKELKDINSKIKQILDCLQTELINKARKDEIFLPAKKQNRNKNSK